MFNFILKKPFVVTPWGKENQRMLHWFGLTDSFYWLNFGEVELLRYHSDFVAAHNLNHNTPYVDYQFARIFQDFTGIVRAILSPVPDEIFIKISTFTNFQSYLSSLSNWLEQRWNESEEDFDNIYLPASQWINDRRLDSGYLIGAPDIYFFTNNNKLYVRWIADYKDENGVPMWEYSAGEHIIDLEIFIFNLQSSIKNFALDMDTQVKDILDNPIKNVFIDTKRLLEIHEEFLEEVRAYERILSFVSPQTDWEEILLRINQIM